MSNFATTSPPLPRIELVLEQRDEVTLVERLFLARPPPRARSATVVAMERRRPVTSWSASRTRSRLRGSSSFSRWNSAVRGNSSVSTLPSSADGPRLAEQRPDPDRLLLGGRDDASLPGVLEVGELERRASGSPPFVGVASGRPRRRPRSGRRVPALPRRPERARRRRGARLLRGRRRCRLPAKPRLEQLDPVGERLALEIGLRAGHLHERQLERKPRVATLAHVLDRDGEQVDQAQHASAREAGSPARAAGRASPRSQAASPGRCRCSGRAADGGDGRADR